MGILRRIFSADFRQAVAAEAEGDFLGAARSYALCGELHKVVDMHLALARQETDPDHRIRELRLALNFAGEQDRRRPMVLRMLAGTLADRGRSLGASSVEGQALLQEAALLCESGESWEEAGDLHLALGRREAAAQAYARGGLVERVEQVLGEEERRRERARREHDCFARHEMALGDGRRDEAAEALRECVEAAEVPADYRRRLMELEERLLTDGVVGLSAGEQRLWVVGRFPVLLGRDPQCDLRLRGHSVSRRHAQISLHAHGKHVTVQDLRTRNGVTLDGIALGAEVPLPASGTLALGGDCQLGFRVEEGEPPRVHLEVTRGMDLGLRALLGGGELSLGDLLEGAPDLLLCFRKGRPMVRGAGGSLRLNGARLTGEVQVIRGDELELDGRAMVVMV